MNNKKPYLIGADIIRVIAGMGVLIIHVTDPFLSYPPYVGIGGLSWWIINMINAFFRVSVPLFVVLSGYLLLDTSRELDISKFYKKRFLRIGIPTLFWLIFYFIWEYRIGELATFGEVAQRLFIANLDHLYFLLIILELYFITPILLIILKNISKKGEMVLLVSMLVLTLGNGIANELYPLDAVNLQKSAFTIFIPYLFFYLLGHFLRNWKISFSSAVSLGLIFLYTTLFIAIMSSGVVGSYLRTSYSITVMFLTTIAFVGLIQCNYAKRFAENRILQRVLQYIASLVFGAYLIHMMVIMLGDTFIGFVPGDIPSPLWIFVLLKIVIVIFISFGIAGIGKKIPYVRILFAA